jgi:hypothetical protein
MEEMKLWLRRFAHGPEDTIGLLHIDGEFECYTLEDEHRTQKVYGRTRIPEGTYDLGLRTEGGFHARYGQRYGELHQGMIQLLQVPNFKYILIHSGNRDEQTAGCLLVGDSGNNPLSEEGFIGSSRQAYVRLYAKVIESVRLGLASIVIEDL